MIPNIDSSKKGKISIHNETINYDFYINFNGEIVNRAAALSEEQDFSPKTISLFEAGQLYDPNINEMIIGCDADDKLVLSNEATDFFEEKRCKIKLLPIKEAVDYWNRYEGRAVGLFHFPAHKN